MPLPPKGDSLLTEPILVEGGVFIPELERRVHELPPPDALLRVVGRGAEDTARWLNDRGRRAQADPRDQVFPTDPNPRPRWRLWEPDPFALDCVPLGTALDVGCGSGRDAVALAASGWQVTGMDPLPDALDRARDLESRYSDGPPIRWMTTLPDEEFDLVLLIRSARVELLDPAWERVRAGGQLVVVGRTDRFAEMLAMRKPETLTPGPTWTRAEFIR